MKKPTVQELIQNCRDQGQQTLIEMDKLITALEATEIRLLQSMAEQYHKLYMEIDKDFSTILSEAPF